MTDVDRILARAQVGLAVLVGLGFMGALGMLLWLTVVATRPIEATVLTLLTGLLGVLGTIFTLIMNYFFARHRPPTRADADEETVPPTQPPPAAKP